ncbi:MAG: hypothetical protein IJR87_06515 [Bacteroidaceae bacterium]|nr:hypothetical protein [Bacteroidaceae bacterium]
MKKTFKTLVFAVIGLLALASCEDVPAPYKVPDNNGGGGGNDTPASIEVTCAQAVELTNALADGATSTETYAITGYITEIVGDVSRNQQTFWMADTKDGGRVFEAYWANLPEGVSAFTAGSKVKITGNLTKYVNNNTGKVTPEMKNPTVEILESGEPTPPSPSGEAKGDGTAASPFNVAGINQFIDGGNYTDKEVYFTGIITKFKSGEEPGNSYGNATFYISDDGKTGGEDFYVFRTFGFNGEKFTSKDQLQVGDLVVIRSTVTVYNGTTKETVAGKGVLVSVNGKAEYSGSGQTPSEGAGTAEKPYSVAEALQIINAGTYTKDKVYVSGIVSKIDEISEQYGNATYYISDDGKTDTQLEVYRGYGLGGEKFQSEDDLMVGDKVIVLGALTLYNTTPEITTGSQLYSINGETAGGGSQGGGSEGSSITFSEKGYSNAQDFDGQSITVGDAMLAWSKGSGSTTPKYYTTGAAMRLYGGNTLTISSQKTISKVEFTYGEDYNGTSYTPTSGDSSVTPEGYNYSTHTWTGSAKSIVLSRTASTGHFRIVSIKISYGE